MTRIPTGIDLGTTNTVVACALDDDRVEIATGPAGERLLPSAVFVAPRGEVHVGLEALERGLAEPGRFFQHFKRDMGDDAWQRKVDGKVYVPVLLSSFVLRRALANAKALAGHDVREAVVTVPAYFGDVERTATLDAARISGLDTCRTLNEPTAAALAFGLDPEQEKDGIHRALVYDLGGGTFDVTIVELGRGTVRVVATAGEHRLGGKDWDDELVNLLAEEAYEKTGVDPREDDHVLAELRRDAEAAKHRLSEALEAAVRIRIPKRKPIEVVVTRDAFEARTRGLLEQTETQVGLVLEKAGLAWAEIEAVLPVGGSTRMPMVRGLLRRMSGGREPRAILHPDEAVARGACAYARLLARGGKIEEDASQASAPASKRPSRPNWNLEDSGVEELEPDPDLPLLPGEARVPEVRDVVSHGLGVLVTTKGGFKNVVIIPEQTAVPVERRRSFCTVRPDQRVVQVKVLEGEDPDPEGCRLIGTLVVDGLPSGRPKGQRVEVAYRYDEDGRVQVSARDLATGKEARATIERRGAIAAPEISRLRAEVAGRVR